MSASVAVMAGSASTAIFVASTLPMLVKAARTKDLASYSFGNIALANLGNLIYAVYVVSLPFGPVWALHGFHVGASALMLFWYIRHARKRFPRPPASTMRYRRLLGVATNQEDRVPSSLASAGKSVVSVFQTTR